MAALEAWVLLMPALGLVAPGGTPLQSMRQLHPSCALSGYDSGEGSPCGPAPRPGLMQPFSIPVQITLQDGRRRPGR